MPFIRCRVCNKLTYAHQLVLTFLQLFIVITFISAELNNVRSVYIDFKLWFSFIHSIYLLYEYHFLRKSYQ